MKALVLASGTGSRLGARRGRSKPLVAVAGVPLLERAVTGLHRAGATEVVVVTGHRAEEVERFCAEVSARREIPVRCVRNPRFTEGNGLSVLAAEAALGGEDFLLAMADHVLDDGLLDALAAAEVPPEGAVLAVDHDVARRPDVDLDDVTRVATAEGRVVRIAKHLAPYDGFDTGAFLCTPAVFGAIAAAATDGDTSLSGAMQRLADQGLLRTCPVSGLRWDDVDTRADHRRAGRRLHRGGGKARDGLVAARLNRALSQRVVTPALLWLAPGITANQVTLLSVAVALAAAVALGGGWPLLGALLVQAASVLDGSDGEVARLRRSGSRYGGFLDPVLDRVADGAIFLGAAVFLQGALDPGRGTQVLVLVVVGAALVGHLMVSYTSAKAALDLGHDFTGALLGAGKGRDVRLLAVTVAAAVASWWPPALAVAMGVLAVMTWGIVVERLRRSWLVEAAPWADVDAVVLDFDGTVADSMEHLADLAVELLGREMGLDPAVARRRYLASSGLDFRTQMEEIAPGDGRAGLVVQAFERAKVELMDRIATFADLEALLAELDRVGVPVAVCSSSTAVAVRHWLDQRGLTPRLAHVDGFRPDHPKVVQLAATVRRLGVRPDRCLFVGDSTRDAAIARACGTRFRGVHRAPTSTFTGSGIPHEADLAAIGRTVRRVRATGIVVERSADPGPEVAGVVGPDEATPAFADGQRGERAVGHLDAAVGGGAGPDGPGHRGPDHGVVGERDDRAVG